MSFYDSLWSIILAGGDGVRTRAWIQSRFGHGLPKQFCVFVGTRSMFQHTLDRSDRVGTPARRVTIVSASYAKEAREQIGNRPAGILVVQPENRDTAAGILLCLAHVRARDPDGLVIIYPSDHCIHPEDRFLSTVEVALRATHILKDRIILLGVAPERAEEDYGWIIPGSVIARVEGVPVRAVEGFLEKPDASTAKAVMNAGALWNTMIFASTARLLWHLGSRFVPALMARFERIRHFVNTEYESEEVESAYRVMPSKNFSRDLLARIPGRIAVVELSGIVWNDWGRPDRILETVAALEKRRCGVSRKAS